MQPVDHLITIPGETIISISDNLEKAAEIVAFAKTCKRILGVFKNAQTGEFFYLFPTQLQGDNLYSNIFHLKSKNFIYLPAASIIVERFHSEMGMLNKLFPKSNYRERKRQLQQAIPVDTRREMLKLSAEYLEYSPGNFHIKKMMAENKSAEENARLETAASGLFGEEMIFTTSDFRCITSYDVVRDQANYIGDFYEQFGKELPARLTKSVTWLKKEQANIKARIQELTGCRSVAPDAGLIGRACSEMNGAKESGMDTKEAETRYRDLLDECSRLSVKLNRLYALEKDAGNQRTTL